MQTEVQTMKKYQLNSNLRESLFDSGTLLSGKPGEMSYKDARMPDCPCPCPPIATVGVYVAFSPI